MKKKIYYEIHFILDSAMNIGCGTNDNSDRDVLKDVCGNPFIPGSTLAGIYRSELDEIDADRYFGNVVINTGDNDNSVAVESSIKVYDAYPERNSNPIIKKRDCVGLDEFKTARKGAKFDFEVIEPGLGFVTYVEQDIKENDDIDIGEIILSKWNSKGLSIGSKTMRGLGRTRLVKVFKAEYDLETDIDSWLDFDMYPDEKGYRSSNWTEVVLSGLKASSKLDGHVISLKLKQKGTSGISIRRYTTEVNTKENTQPDYVQLTSTVDGEERPIIPGTSWAGAFKHQMERYLRNPQDSEEWFGSTRKKSKIEFGESVIKGSTPKLMTRNAIDRFSGGTVDGALYTEKYYYGGETELTIVVPKDKNVKAELVNSLVASLFDLHFGFMAIGGLTAVGRGLFDITEGSIDGENVIIPGPDTAGKVFTEWCKRLTETEVYND